jgi:hypothetical protein
MKQQIEHYQSEYYRAAPPTRSPVPS